MLFYWRMRSSLADKKNVVPDFIDFEFTIDTKTGLLKQNINGDIERYLETIYKENFNVGYLQEGHALAEGYGNDFTNFIKKAVSKYNPNISSILEIGAGGCYLLSRLKADGFCVTAIDPSPVAKEAADKLDINILQEFYPSSSSDKFDLIIHYDVLEHIENPWEFLRQHAKDLCEDGLVIFAVPDCNRYIHLGDISMAIHEHINFFDDDSIESVVKLANLNFLEVSHSEYGGVIYCVASISKQKQIIDKVESVTKFNNFSDKATSMIKRLEEFVNQARKDNNTIGFYVPLRAMPYLAKLEIKDQIRFFDDDPGIHGKYFDGYDFPVENFDDLCANPVSHLVIISDAFGEKIKNKILDYFANDEMKILTLPDKKDH